MARRILVVGYSHVDALERAKAGDSRFDNIEICWLMSKSGIGRHSLEHVDERIAALRSEDLLVFAILGTLHNIQGLLRPEIPFDFFYPPSSSILADSAVVPVAALRDHFDKLIGGNKLVASLAASAPCNATHLAAPPVKGEDDWIYANAHKYRGSSIRDVGLNPARLRAKLWRLEMDCIARRLKELKIDFLPPPDEAINGDDFLRRPFYGPDVTHANRDYGQLVLRDLLALA